MAVIGAAVVLVTVASTLGAASETAVYYLGKEVDNYKNGKIVDHDGSWRLSRDTRSA